MFSPLLFIIAYDPLLSRISTLPGISPYAFADDLAFTADTVEIISPALLLISEFSELSGLGINRDKSCVISSAPSSTHSSLRDSLLACPWPLLPLRPITTHLGIPIGRDVTLENIFEVPYSKALSRLATTKPVVSKLSVLFFWPTLVLIIETKENNKKTTWITGEKLASK